MLDLKFIRDNADLVKREAAAKNFTVDISLLLSLDEKVRATKRQIEDLKTEQNALSKKFTACSKEERLELTKQSSALKSEIETKTPELRELEAKLQEILLTVPQPAREDVPAGKDDSENVEIKKYGNIPNFSFKSRDHIELGEKLGMIDIERGVKIAGSRSFALVGNGALLERALLNFAYDKIVRKGYKPVCVPVLVKEHAMEGTGYFPLGKDQAYCVEKDQLALVGTAEVSLCSMFADEIFNSKDLPLKLVAQSSCFRREAGTYGKDTKGLYRVHQFQKIEMVHIAQADPALSEKLHSELLGIAEEILQDLQLAYRVVYVCKGDLGLGQVRKHDIETWMPSRNSYGETHSCSTFYDFQARRLKIRYKNDEKQNIFAYTLNNTAIATPRVILAILENYQREDGTVQVPEVLQPYLGGLKEFT